MLDVHPTFIDSFFNPTNITSPFQMTEDQNRKCSNFVPLFYRCKKGVLALRTKYNYTYIKTYSSQKCFHLRWVKGVNIKCIY